MMSGEQPSIIKIDFKDVRKSRQKTNNLVVYQNIIEKNFSMFDNNINKLAFERVLEDLNFTREQFFIECERNHPLCKVVSMHISKCASRQGCKDEDMQLKTCNYVTSKYGIKIENLSATAIRPTKDGRILLAKDLKMEKIPKDQCLKSFDGLLTGRLEGYIAAKVCMSGGGHQDNVFEEMDNIAEWWTKFKSNSSDKLLILIDTDLHSKFTIIKNKHINQTNILVFNHVEFQEYIMHNYS